MADYAREVDSGRPVSIFQFVGDDGRLQVEEAQKACSKPTVEESLVPGALRLECIGCGEVDRHFPRSGSNTEKVRRKPHFVCKAHGCSAGDPGWSPGMSYVHLVGQKRIKAALRSGNPGVAVSCEPVIKSADGQVGRADVLAETSKTEGVCVELQRSSMGAAKAFAREVQRGGAQLAIEWVFVLEGWQYGEQVAVPPNVADVLGRHGYAYLLGDIDADRMQFALLLGRHLVARATGKGTPPRGHAWVHLRPIPVDELVVTPYGLARPAMHRWLTNVAGGRHKWLQGEVRDAEAEVLNEHPREQQVLAARAKRQEARSAHEARLELEHSERVARYTAALTNDAEARAEHTERERVRKGALTAAAQQLEDLRSEIPAANDEAASFADQLQAKLGEDVRIWSRGKYNRAVAALRKGADEAKRKLDQIVGEVKGLEAAIERLEQPESAPEARAKPEPVPAVTAVPAAVLPEHEDLDLQEARRLDAEDHAAAVQEAVKWPAAQLRHNGAFIERCDAMTAFVKSPRLRGRS